MLNFLKFLFKKPDYFNIDEYTEIIKNQQKHYRLSNPVKLKQELIIDAEESFYHNYY